MVSLFRVDLCIDAELLGGRGEEGGLVIPRFERGHVGPHCQLLLNAVICFQLQKGQESPSWAHSILRLIGDQ